MAKRRRHGKKRRRGMRGLGSTLVVRRGLGNLFKGQGLAATILPPIIGVGVAAATVLGVRHFANPADTAGSGKMLFKNAGWLALGAGAVSAAALYVLGGTKAAAAAFVGAAGVSAVILGHDHLMTSSPNMAAGLAGLGAIVPEYAGMRGLGAIVMQPQLSGPRGETVQLGAINPGAFGTAGFHP